MDSTGVQRGGQCVAARLEDLATTATSLHLLNLITQPFGPNKIKVYPALVHLPNKSAQSGRKSFQLPGIIGLKPIGTNVLQFGQLLLKVITVWQTNDPLCPQPLPSFMLLSA